METTTEDRTTDRSGAVSGRRPETGTIGISELKQYPRAAVDRVKESGTPLEITQHGRPTGVYLTPEITMPTKPMVLRADDLARFPRLPEDVAEEWLAEYGADREEEIDTTDPWA